MSNSLTLTVAEFDKMVQCGAFEHLNRKVELIRGEIRTMNPAGTILNDLIAFLLDWSVRSTNRNEIRVTVQAGIDLRALQSQPEPDLAWVRADRYRDKHPTAEDVRLAIEVSDSSLETDWLKS
ncbi:MAG: Uma2 family endonuclease [Pirellulales bacterium]